MDGTMDGPLDVVPWTAPYIVWTGCLFALAQVEA